MFMLPEIAKELAEPPAKETPIEINFDKNWFVLGEPDRINLKNASGQELTRATLQVDIRGRSGSWVRNIHFVDKGAPGHVLWAPSISQVRSPHARPLSPSRRSAPWHLAAVDRC
jgi:hypothetical protein